MSNLSINLVRDLQKSVEYAHAQVEKQEVKIVADVFKFVNKYLDGQIEAWLEAEKIVTTKKANVYTGVIKMAFAKLDSDNVSDQRVSFYASICLAIDFFKISKGSGGIDSTITYFLLKHQKPKNEIIPIFVNLRQSYWKKELIACQNLFKDLRCLETNTPTNDDKDNSFIPNPSR